MENTNDKVTVKFLTDRSNKERVKRLAKKTGHSASFFYNILLERYLGKLESSFIAGKDVKDDHLDNMER